MAFLDNLFAFAGPYSEYIVALIIIIVSVFVAKVIVVSVQKKLAALTAKTDTILDDLIIKAIGKPIYLGVILAGVFFALQSLTALAAYSQTISMAFTVIYVLFAAFFVTRIVDAILQWYSKEIAAKTKTKADEQFLPIVRRIALAVVYFIALLVLLGQFGINISSLVVVGGIGGLAVAFAFQDTLKEFFAGAYMILDRPIKIGDYIELDSGERGYVQDIGWRSTKLRIYGNNIMIIPNSTISSAKITNYYTKEKKIMFGVECGVGYHEDLEKVEKVAIRVGKNILKKVEGGIPDYEPLMRFKEFGDSNINFSVILSVREYINKFKVRHEFIKALKKEFDKQGIEISWPIRKVYMYKGKGK